MTALASIVTGLASAALFQLIIWSFYEARAKWQNASIRRFFGVNGSHTLIIHTAITDTSRHAPAIPACDSQLIRCVAALLERVGLQEGRDFSIMNASGWLRNGNPDEVRLKDYNLVLIGGPKGNAITSAVFNRRLGRYRMVCAPPKECFMLHEGHTGADLIATRDRQGDSATDEYDYGLVMSIANPFGEPKNSNTLVTLAGLHGTGTIGISKCLYHSLGKLLNPRAKLAARLLGLEWSGGSFEDVVKVDHGQDPEDVVRVTSVASGETLWAAAPSFSHMSRPSSTTTRVS